MVLILLSCRQSTVGLSNQLLRKHIHTWSYITTLFTRTYNIGTAGGDRFFCIDIGCQHACGESYLATGGLNISDISDSWCGSSCPICTRRWHEIFLPVYRSSVVQFLELLMQTGQLPHQINYNKPISVFVGTQCFFGRRQYSIVQQVVYLELTLIYYSYLL